MKKPFGRKAVNMLPTSNSQLSLYSRNLPIPFLTGLYGHTCHPAGFIILINLGIMPSLKQVIFILNSPALDPDNLLFLSHHKSDLTSRMKLHQVKTSPSTMTSRLSNTMTSLSSHGKRSRSISIRPESYPEKIVDFVSPQANRDVSFKDVDKDQEAVDERPPKTAITTKELLTRGEKMRLLDLLKQYHEVMRVYGYSYSAEETYTEFFEKVFRRDWNTKWKSVNPLVFRPLRSSDAHLEISYYEKDAPSSQSEDGRRRSKALKQTIPVFLTLNLEGGEIDWKYHDRDGNRLRARDVTLHDGLSNLQAKKNTLKNQDYQERKHIYRHNIDQVVQVARRRIVKWATAGSNAQLGVDKDAESTWRHLNFPQNVTLLYAKKSSPYAIILSSNMN